MSRNEYPTDVTDPTPAQVTNIPPDDTPALVPPTQEEFEKALVALDAARYLRILEAIGETPQESRRSYDSVHSTS